MSRQPNILLILSDQHRGDWLGFIEAAPVRTPNIDRLARQGVAFTQAITPSPLCAPARAAFATGLSYDRCPVKHNGHDLPTDATTIYRQMAQHGFHLATCGKLDLLKGAADWGLDGLHGVAGQSRLHALGFTAGLDSGGKHDAVRAYQNGIPEPYLAYLAERGLAEAHVRDYEKRGQAESDHPLDGSNPVQFVYTEATPLPDDAYCDNWVGRRGLDLIRSAPRDRPWFLQVNFCGPHEPMDVTKAMQAGWEDTVFPRPDERGDLPPAKHQAIRRNYAAMIETIDQWIGRYVALLAEAGMLEHTIVIYASDHGEMLGDHGLWTKQIPLHPSIHVPLVLHGPGFEGGLLSSQPVNLLDLSATILDMAGAERPAAMEGRSLRRTLQEDLDPRTAFSGLGCWRLAFNGRFKLIAGFDRAMSRREMMRTRFADVSHQPPVLYDLETDPGETRNIAADHPAIVAALMGELGAWIAGTNSVG